MADNRGCAGIGRIALVGEVERRRTFAADQQQRLMVGIEQVEQLLACRLDRKHRSRARSVDPQRPPGTEPGYRGADGASAQASTSTIRGTWSDGRSQLRH